MSRSVSDTKRVARRAAVVSVALLAGSLAGCDIEPPEYQYGFNITGIQFELYNENVGIHPNLDVLLDPNNPFATYGIDPNGTAKFDILNAGGNAGAFYAWATVLANAATGEAQYYTAVKLRDIYEAKEVPDEQLPILREMAIRAFQATLDYFPESVIFNEAGDQTTRIATFAYLEIEALGGTVQGDWVLVQKGGDEGGVEAVRSAPIDPPRADPEDEDDG